MGSQTKSFESTLGACACRSKVQGDWIGCRNPWGQLLLRILSWKLTPANGRELRSIVTIDQKE
eukprot:551404-Amphidinium_carterae.1